MRFELSTRVVCIKDIEDFKVGRVYYITGCGDLAMSSDKSGYGFCVSGDGIVKKNYGYFTEREMNDYFITEEEDYKMYKRNNIINSILYERHKRIL